VSIKYELSDIAKARLQNVLQLIYKELQVEETNTEKAYEAILSFVGGIYTGFTDKSAAEFLKAVEKDKNSREC